MISAKVYSADKIIYVDVDGYITSNDAKEFLNSYKKMTKSIKASQYQLIVEPGDFECENNKDIKNVCMEFFKSGYNKMYLVDPQGSIMKSLSLGPIEKKLFSKAVKFIKSTDEVM